LTGPPDRAIIPVAACGKVDPTSPRAVWRRVGFGGQGVGVARRPLWRLADYDQVVLWALAAVLLAAAVARSAATWWADRRPVRRVERGEEIRYRVNVNRASLVELDLLPGIGPAKAQRIVDHRRAEGPFARIDDLANVPGISQPCVERLRPLASVGPAPSGEERAE